MYVAHIKKDETEQSVYAHCKETAELSRLICRIPQLKELAYLGGILHDVGKNTDEFYHYIKQAHKDPQSVKRGSVIHSMAGAQIVTEFGKQNNKMNNITMELIRHAIMSHHGLYDCIDDDGEVKYQVRKKVSGEVYQRVKDEIYKNTKQEELSNIFQTAVQNVSEMLHSIIDYSGKTNSDRYTAINFYLGLCERILLGSLIDADRIDTECFMESRQLPSLKADEISKLWDKYLVELENTIKGFHENSQINKYRNEISEACKEAGKRKEGVYKLIVPTGAGKTLASFRYALEHARTFKKKHIIYIAPYRSILEQNAQTLRDVFGKNAKLLEHHSDVVFEEESEIAEYEKLTQNWDSPIIVTTAVQFLNTLFSSKSGSIRRMNSLCDAVIIVDEIQALPLKCTYLFNLSMNFLQQFGASTVVLCSATQPPLDKLSENQIYNVQSIIHDEDRYLKLFKRTTVIDKTEAPMSFNELASFMIKQTNNTDSKSLLAIVNKKVSAYLLTEHLKEQNDETGSNIIIYHLSTYMCPAHRLNQINDIRKKLDEIRETKSDQKLICVSTQMLEAGVDLSFHTVIRSLAGMDSIVQAAGRCNRNGECENGNVYIVKIADENVNQLKEIERAQAAAEQVLYHCRSNQKNNDLLSIEAMEKYYALYYNDRKQILSYPVSRGTTILEMLSMNQNFYNQCSASDKSKINLRQAFRTAGDEFEVIDKMGNIDILVYYKDSSEIIRKYQACKYSSEKRTVLRKLQQYTVSIPYYLYEKLKPHIDETDEKIKIISKKCYDSVYGISNKEMPLEYLDI
ncbi:MAG: CRISPR-associated helicase Cas3' [Lachnoclostridium sp.]|jgi:CRISPR-associated endonuclease/helicase Cas3|nr:CRISPR-associated helicase Cas3' [Lachnoclostridium sp.]